MAKLLIQYSSQSQKDKDVMDTTVSNINNRPVLPCLLLKGQKIVHQYTRSLILSPATTLLFITVECTKPK